MSEFIQIDVPALDWRGYPVTIKAFVCEGCGLLVGDTQVHPLACARVPEGVRHKRIMREQQRLLDQGVPTPAPGQCENVEFPGDQASARCTQQAGHLGECTWYRS